MKVIKWIFARVEEQSTWMLIAALTGLIGWQLDSNTLMYFAGFVVAEMATGPNGVIWKRYAKK